MAMLHTVNKSPFERSSLQSCLAHASAGASVLLFEDGVYGALKGSSVAGQVQEAMGQCTLYALGPDLKARGLDESKLIDGINVVDYAGFVNLAAECDKVQAWL
jgi:tRNA 2-thiouridine synthesizing protein B